MISIDVNAEALKDYSDKLQKWICIFDEIERNYEASLKRVRSQNIILTRKIDSIIPEKREHYISALNDLNRFLSNMQNTDRNDTVFLRTVNVMQKSVNERKRDLDHAISTKTKIEKLYADFETNYKRNLKQILTFKETIIDLIKKSHFSINEYVDAIEKSEKEIKTINNIIVKTSRLNGITCRSLTAQSSISQVDFINNALSVYKHNNDKPLGYYLDDIRHEEISGFPATNQEWHSQGDYSVFNTPEETGKVLDSCQGKLDGFWGTCGCMSCVNILKLAGIDISEEELVTYAATHSNMSGESLCTYGHADYAANGGTTSLDRKNILEAYGVKSELVPASIDNIFRAVGQGKGVIASVHADYLYEGKISADDRHAIIITSVKYKNGKPYSIITCDSNNRPCEEYYVSTFQTALTDNPLNVTTKIIR